MYPGTPATTQTTSIEMCERGGRGTGGATGGLKSVDAGNLGTVSSKNTYVMRGRQGRRRLHDQGRMATPSRSPSPSPSLSSSVPQRTDNDGGPDPYRGSGVGIVYGLEYLTDDRDGDPVLLPLDREGRRPFRVSDGTTGTHTHASSFTYTHSVDGTGGGSSHIGHAKDGDVNREKLPTIASASQERKNEEAAHESEEPRYDTESHEARRTDERTGHDPI